MQASLLPGDFILHCKLSEGLERRIFLNGHILYCNSEMLHLSPTAMTLGGWEGSDLTVSGAELMNLGMF